MFDFVYKQQYVFLNRDYTIRISWWLKTLSLTYASLKMVQNELKHVKDMKECVTPRKCVWFVFIEHHKYILSSNGELFILSIKEMRNSCLQ